MISIIRSFVFEFFSLCGLLMLLSLLLLLLVGNFQSSFVLSFVRYSASNVTSANLPDQKNLHETCSLRGEKVNHIVLGESERVCVYVCVRESESERERERERKEATPDDIPK